MVHVWLILLLPFDQIKKGKKKQTSDNQALAAGASDHPEECVI